jgi:release factor glutamine methyltransferase
MSSEASVVNRRSYLDWLAPARRALSRWQLRLWFALTQRHCLERIVVETVAGQPIIVLPTVFNPRLFRSGAFLAETLGPSLVPAGSAVLDLGTGSGVLATVAAVSAQRVVAVDLNPEAVRCARINTLLHGCEDRVEVRYGDLFQAVAGERFDVVLFNPPYYRGAPVSDFDRAWRSPDVVERFANELTNYLQPGGRALVVLSTDGEARSFLASFSSAGLSVTTVAQRRFKNETFSVYALRART